MNIQNLRELERICRYGVENELDIFLNNNPEYVSKPFGEHGEYADHFAAIANHKGNMIRLLTDEENVNVRDSYGNTPLHYAVINSSKDVINLLLEKGADIHATNNDGQSVLQWCPPDIRKILESKGESQSADEASGAADAADESADEATGEATGKATELPRREAPEPPRRDEFVYKKGVQIW